MKRSHHWKLSLGNAMQRCTNRKTWNIFLKCGVGIDWKRFPWSKVQFILNKAYNWIATIASFESLEFAQKASTGDPHLLWKPRLTDCRQNGDEKRSENFRFQNIAVSHISQPTMLHCLYSIGSHDPLTGTIPRFPIRIQLILVLTRLLYHALWLAKRLLIIFYLLSGEMIMLSLRACYWPIKWTSVRPATGLSNKL